MTATVFAPEDVGRLTCGCPDGFRQEDMPVQKEIPEPETAQPDDETMG